MFDLSAASRIVKLAAFTALVFTVFACARAGSVLPDNQVNAAASATGNSQTAVFAGGCFWGVDAVFKHVKGVSDVESGYVGGRANTAHYEQVSSGGTGHAEAVRVRFDPAQVSYQQLLQVFFGVAHDPTQLNRQGPDVGNQYRSAIFYVTPDQERLAKAYVQQVTGARTFAKPVVTEIVPLQQFYRAEEHHQNYLALHPSQPYIVFNDMPKLEQLRKQLPTLYR